MNGGAGDPKPQLSGNTCSRVACGTIAIGLSV
ncbi:hypothetical protein BMS3Abin04_00797 [bacterium BMS3Abin04]|nr:hypothetical protein BMS3Abin04_00797 [bacterium BMS3Abin04]